MDFQHPFRILTPNLEGDILSLLSRADKSYTGREMQRALGVSQDAVRLALRRLATQGVVTAEPGGGRAILYQLNRDHLASPWIQGIASLRLELIERLRSEIQGWTVQPAAAVLFGSVARNEATRTSDLDLLIIRPARVGADDDAWQAQLLALIDAANRWTGNEARVLEYGADELIGLVGQEPVLQHAAEEGIDLAGSFRSLWKQAQRS